MTCISLIYCYCVFFSFFISFMFLLFFIPHQFMLSTCVCRLTINGDDDDDDDEFVQRTVFVLAKIGQG